MKNAEVARLLYLIADMLEIKDENVFKTRAYRRAAQAIETLSKPIEELAKEERLDIIPGVGSGIAEKVLEFLETGKIEYYNDLKKKMPMDFEGLMAIEGMGPKKVKTLYQKLKIKTVKDLEAAVKAGKVRKIEGFGEKTEQNIMKGIQFSKTDKRMPTGFALPIADEIISYLKKHPSVKQANYAGSLRRMKESIGDIDILATSSDPEKVIDHFVKIREVIDIMARGPTKASVHLVSGLQVDLRVLPEKEYGSALLYFTGSKEHNIALRRVAIAKKLKLSEYGLFKGSKIIAAKTEEDVYRGLGLDYIEPEMREDHGEIELAQKHKLPKLIGYSDICGDLQMHSTWSDGANSIEEMALTCKKMGYDYMCITDHVGELKIARALSEKDVEKQAKEIEKVRSKVDIKILHGAEVDIRLDGKFDISNECLSKLDIVLASLHSGLKLDEAKSTARVLAALENPHIDIFAHPTGRLIGRREGAPIDIQKVIKKVLETNKILEIDAQPDRMDLSDINAFAAREAGCKLVIDTDAHNKDQLRFMKLGIATARRAWCEKKDIINTLPYNKLCKFFDIRK